MVRNRNTQQSSNHGNTGGNQQSNNHNRGDDDVHHHNNNNNFWTRLVLNIRRRADRLLHRRNTNAQVPAPTVDPLAINQPQRQEVPSGQQTASFVAPQDGPQSSYYPQPHLVPHREPNFDVPSFYVPDPQAPTTFQHVNVPARPGDAEARPRLPTDKPKDTD